ncbi:Metallo-dependent phosphatase-like protein [Hyaloraphidium curvatum]|nr:Metallo-dependent phosphatase-like protein [Hyaloraphidium curvatum]
MRPWPALTALPDPPRLLALAWVAALLVGEVLVFRIATWRCGWPQLDQARRNPGAKVARVAIIADPQLSDPLSYNQKPGSLTLWVTQFTCDYYMRKAYAGVLSHLEPDVVVFLGDLFDGGRVWDNATWNQELRRFAGIFRLYGTGSNAHDVFYVAGNHDYGIGDGVVASAYARFTERFGNPNWAVQIANHTLIAVDTLSLSATGDSAPKQAAENFLHAVEALRPKLPNRILFSHVPLWRPDDAPCGSLRGSRPIRQGSGHQYQNLLTKALTGQLIRKVEPDVGIFSGDDHDHCLYTHHQGPNTYSEHTVGSFSWQQGNRHPSFALLTLFPTNVTEPDFQTAAVGICFLPDQIAIYIFYGFLFVATLAVLGATVCLGLDWTERERKRPKSPTVGWPREAPREEVVWESGINGLSSPVFFSAPSGPLRTHFLPSLQMRVRHLYPVFLRALGSVALHGILAFLLCVAWEHLY